MLEIKRALGQDSWLSQGNLVRRREAIQDLFLTYPVRPEEADEEWPDDRRLYSEMVVMDGEKLVGTGMLVVDPEREDRPARIFGLGFLPEYLNDFNVHTLEEVLIAESNLDEEYPFVEASDGKLVPNPYSHFSDILENIETISI